MKLFKSPLRRSTAALAGTFLGLAGVVVFAAPASAHHPVVAGTPSCVKEDGTWTVEWTVTNSEKDLQGDITSVTAGPEGSTFTGIKVQDVLPKNGEGELKGTQTLPASAESATLTIGAHWKRGYTDRNADNSGTVRKSQEKCAPTDKPSTPPTKPSTPPTKPSKPAEPNEPTPIVEADCTTVSIGFDNPKDGMEFTLHLKTSKGEKRDVTIKPGDRKVEKFSATPGFQIKLSVSAKGYGTSPVETITYQLPEGCDSNGGGGGLPVTGAAAGSIAGGAAALLAIGGVLFFLARRRKVKFTA
ncbi:LPXTG-motif cell wall-anchored protein [Krasilnikovia cinnamomea]|uniref:LPXTG-motif cell wall-anchored protein n=1 Tax=Krasilnikovia cinnamomea TaxID=349313 RepID=A0A4Q7ZG89_9ACTN|nr:LPXTG cell wall anchor domain-containing protein [Krasilnikovia cinnamomea]RZU49802.1 LPXTG-motif cell wall-anchored protein [Krasilnikovia cinnamomea]